jgi:hypothetical protein
MGFQTEFMILNDAAHMIKERPVEFADKIYDACLDGEASHKEYKYRGYYPDTYSMSLGNYCNPIVVSRPQHADVNKVYIAGKNDMINVSFSNWSEQYKRMVVNFPFIIDSHISILEHTLRDLKDLRKKIKND